MTVLAGKYHIICVLPVKTLEPKCTTVNNSPAARPEFVDISMIVTTGPENGLPVDGVRENMTKCILYSDMNLCLSSIQSHSWGILS